METKTIQLEIPEYLTVEQYLEVIKLPETESKLQQNLYLISTITGIDIEELQYWDLDSLKKVSDYIQGIIDPKNEFHSILEWNGKMYGYSNIKQQTAGEYIDLELLCKDVDANLHKIAAILYRPIVDHKFHTVDFIKKNTIQVLKHKDVANVFDYYTIEKYSSEKRKKVEDEFKHFPISVLLGAISFFLANASLYLNSIAYSEVIPEKKIEKLNQAILESLSQSIGAGGGLSTLSVKPIYYQFQGKKELQTLTS